MSTNDGANGGYGRPPKDGRFKPGCSGNPSGRPKGARNLQADLDKTLKKRVAIREDGKLRYASRLEGMLLKHYAQAAQGDTKASSQLLTMLEKMEFYDTPPSQPDVVTDNDRAIVEDFLRRNNEATSAVRGTTSTEYQTAVDPSNNGDTTGIAGDQKGATQ